MSTMVGAPRTPACRRADQEREAHGTAARGQWDAAGVHRPQNVTAGQACPSATREPSRRPAARTSRPRRLRSRHHGRRSGVPVGEQDVPPLAELGEQAGRAGSRCRRRTAPSCTLASMCRWSRRTGIVVGRSRSRPRGDDRERGHGPASCRSDQKGASKAAGVTRPAASSSSTFRANAGTRSSGGNTWTETTSTRRSRIRPRRHQSRRWSVADGSSVDSFELRDRYDGRP